jgi:ribosomal protein S18 acetylase RimI-like enzyme
VRDATTGDAPAIAGIGREAMPAQYLGLVDPGVIAAAVTQTYALPAVADCIGRCLDSDAACFLVAERSQRVVGFLHFDDFGPEPELHRLYVDHRYRSGGIGARLMGELHRRIPTDLAYMLLVVSGNHRAVRFYERAGLRIERIVDGLEYYGQRMGVTFAADAGAVDMVLMRRQVS